MGRKYQRAWQLLRVALLWKRKGGVLKRRLVIELSLALKFLKNLRHSTSRNQICYGERELSFDNTPVFHVQMYKPTSMRFKIPCITQQVVFDDEDEEYGYHHYFDDGRKSFLRGRDEEEHVYGDDDCDDRRVNDADEEGIDLRAEKFIAQFYEQMKLQRQISYLQYNEKLSATH